jgi:hypothetical protein
MSSYQSCKVTDVESASVFSVDVHLLSYDAPLPQPNDGPNFARLLLECEALCDAGLGEGIDEFDETQLLQNGDGLFSRVTLTSVAKQPTAPGVGTGLVARYRVELKTPLRKPAKMGMGWSAAAWVVNPAADAHELILVRDLHKDSRAKKTPVENRLAELEKLIRANKLFGRAGPALASFGSEAQSQTKLIERYLDHPYHRKDVGEALPFIGSESGIAALVLTLWQSKQASPLLPDLKTYQNLWIALAWYGERARVLAQALLKEEPENFWVHFARWQVLRDIAARDMFFQQAQAARKAVNEDESFTFNMLLKRAIFDGPNPIEIIEAAKPHLESLHMTWAYTRLKQTPKKQAKPKAKTKKG